MADRAGSALFISSFRNICFFGVLMFTTMPATSEVASRDLTIYLVEPISDQKILPTSETFRVLDSNRIRIRAARDTYEPASFVLRSEDRDHRAVSVKASDLSGSGYVIPSTALNIRLVQVWYQGSRAWDDHHLDRNSPPKLVPELLVKDQALVKLDAERMRNLLRVGPSKYLDVSDSTIRAGRYQPSAGELQIQDSASLRAFSLVRGENRQVWITVNIPSDAPPGDYKGYLKIEERGSEVSRINLELTVLPFPLEPPSIEYSIYYRSMLTADEGTISSERKSEQQYRAELENLFAHGVRNPTIYQNPYNEQLFSRVLELREETGMSNDTLYVLGIGTGIAKTPAKIKALQGSLSRIKERLAGRGVKHLYVYGKDEPTPDEQLLQREVMRAVHAVGLRVFTAVNRIGFYTNLGDLLDLAVYTFGHNDAKAIANYYRSSQHRLYGYGKPQTGPENPKLFRRQYGFDLWALGFDGAMPYAYQDSFGFVWNDFDAARYRDHAFTYPTMKGVIDTIAWEGFREGIDDIRYLTTLISWIDRLQQCDCQGSEGRRALTEAVAVVEHLRAAKVSSPQGARHRVIAAILKLVDTGVGQGCIVDSRLAPPLLEEAGH